MEQRRREIPVGGSSRARGAMKCEDSAGSLPQSGKTAAGVMKVRIVGDGDEQAWDRMVEEHPFGSVFQTSAFKKVIAETFAQTKPYYLALIDRNGKMVGGIAMFLVRSRLTGRRLVSLPFVYYSDPLVRTGAEFAQLFEKILDVYKEEKASYVEIKARSSAALLEKVETMVPVLYHKRHSLNLAKGLDAVWVGFHRTCIKQKIRRAEKSGIVIRSAASEKDIAFFHRLLVRTRRRLGIPPQNYGYFENIWKHLGPLGVTDFLVAEKGEQIIGGLNIFKYKDTVYLAHIVGDQRFRASGTDQALIWSAIKTGVRGGYRQLDIGKTSMFATGLTAHKRRWGAEELEAPHFYYPYLRGIASHNNEKRISYKLTRLVWRSMPGIPARIAGRFVYRHMG